jgi:hypothetical protein
VVQVSILSLTLALILKLNSGLTETFLMNKPSLFSIKTANYNKEVLKVLMCWHGKHTNLH